MLAEAAPSPLTYVPEMDWAAPDYAAVFTARLAKLKKLRQDPTVFPGLRTYYKTHIPQFIVDWGVTFDPRNQEVGLPALIPFVLFDKQVDWCDWVIAHWQGRHRGVTVKARDLGVSWLAVALGASLCLFWDGLTIGYGSRKLELVDHLGDPDSLFWKAREFLAHIPREFRGGWTRECAPEKRIMFPGTGSIMKGEGGDEIGRGGRSSIYFVDEASKLAHPMLAEAALSNTTNCRIDIGTANGLGNIFHEHVTSWPPEHVFYFGWRDDPRKDDAWYARQLAEQDPAVVAQEVDIDFAAATEGVMIPSEWVAASIDADARLGLTPSGADVGALDVADEGRDQCAFLHFHGHTLVGGEEWSGKGSDIYKTTVRAMNLAEAAGLTSFRYDADGLGAGVRGDSVNINAERLRAGRPQITALAYRGSGGVTRPRAEDVRGRKNEDFFGNLKAQNWWHTRTLFFNTWRAVTQGAVISPDELISIPSTLKKRNKLVAELSQVTYSLNSAGKIIVDKAPDGAHSPNLADCVVIARARLRAPIEIPEGAPLRAARAGMLAARRR